mgnify:CR=1 FL=1
MNELTEEQKAERDSLLLDQMKRIWFTLGKPTQELNLGNLRYFMQEVSKMKKSMFKGPWVDDEGYIMAEI